MGLLVPAPGRPTEPPLGTSWPEQRDDTVAPATHPRPRNSTTTGTSGRSRGTRSTAPFARHDTHLAAAGRRPRAGSLGPLPDTEPAQLRPALPNATSVPRPRTRW